MAAVKGRNTGPELAFRKALWSLGSRFRNHPRDVPGRPDISHKAARVAVFIDGCFWHGCPDHYTRPKGNRPFWDAKLKRNIQRRVEVRQALTEQGWVAVEIWTCALKRDPAKEARRVKRLIDRRKP